MKASRSHSHRRRDGHYINVHSVVFFLQDIYAKLEFQTPSQQEAAAKGSGPGDVHGSRHEPSNYSDIDHVATLVAAGEGVGHDYKNLDEFQTNPLVPGYDDIDDETNAT